MSASFYQPPDTLPAPRRSALARRSLAPRATTERGGATPAGLIFDGRRIMAATCAKVGAIESWAELVAAFRSADVSAVRSDAAELSYVPEACSCGICPETFPARIAALLYERYVAVHGDSRRGLVFEPAAAADHYGAALRDAVIEHAQNWALPGAFARWVREANVFLDAPAG